MPARSSMNSENSIVGVRQYIAVNEPVITAAAKKYVADVMESGWISSAGKTVDTFEQRFADYLGVKHAVATSSGTTALHLTLATLAIGVGDEVIVPNFTMMATVNAVLYTGATPVFVDCEADIYAMDPSLIERAITHRTRAIVPVHVYGHSADMEPILSIAKQHGLWVVEDAAEAHGAQYKGQLCGALGDLAAFSFFANKIISTGEGGMLVTNDDAWAERARQLRNMAHAPGKRFVHTELGFSYRMTSLQAACGLGQLEHIHEFVERKHWIAARYYARLKDFSQLVLPATRAWAENVFWMYAVRVSDNSPQSRDSVREQLSACGIETRDFFYPCATQPMMARYQLPVGHFPSTDKVSATGFYLPSGLAITAEQIDFVCDTLANILSS